MKRLNPREGYDLYAGDYRKDHPLLDSFMNGAESVSWFRALDGLLSVRERAVALDVGCGDGRTLGRWVRGVEKRGLSERVALHGADVSVKMLEAARGRVKGPAWHRLDLTSLEAVSAWSAVNGPVDVVSAFFVLVHIEKPKTFFAGAAAVLSPGGRLVMNTIPQPKPPELRAQGKPIIIAAWDHDVEDVVTAGEAAGFTLEHREDFIEKDEVVSTLLEWRYGE